VGGALDGAGLLAEESAVAGVTAPPSGRVQHGFSDGLTGRAHEPGVSEGGSALTPFDGLQVECAGARFVRPFARSGATDTEVMWSTSMTWSCPIGSFADVAVLTIGRSPLKGVKRPKNGQKHALGHSTPTETLNAASELLCF